jgi:acyl-coenzyme A synthetase/AMP-(fatty) acid ligase
MNNSEHYPLIERDPADIIAYRAGGPVSVGKFVAEARTLSAKLPDYQYVINLHADRYRYLLGFCAAIIAGHCTLMPPNRQPQTLAQLKQDYPDGYSMGSEDLGALVEENTAVSDAVASYPQISGDQLCAIAFTSGSTGTPKPHLKYWQTLRTGSFSSDRLLLGDLTQTINLIATVPAQHMWGLETSILLPMFGAAAVGHVCPFFPQDISDALAELPEPRGLISSPIHLKTLLQSGVQVPNIKRIYTATAPLSRALAEEIEVTLDTQVLDVFGCTESGILATRFPCTESLWKLSDEFDLAARDDGIEIRAEHLPENVLMPDIVELEGEGRFRWLGRQQDMINIAGKRGSLGDLNRRLRSMSGVQDGVIFAPAGSDDRLAALVVAPNLKASDILNSLKQHVEPVFLPRPVYLVDALPRHETGKLAIKAVNARFDELRKGKIRDGA